MSSKEKKQFNLIDTQSVKIMFHKYTVHLGIRNNIDLDTKEFVSKDLGTFEIISATALNDFELVANLKRENPELYHYRNINVVDKDREPLEFSAKYSEIKSLITKKR